MEKIYLFAIGSRLTSKDKASTLQRYLAYLEKKEGRFKNDDNVIDREIEKLVQKIADT